MYELTAILALAMLLGMAAYMIVESAFEASPPRGSGARRDIVNALAAAIAAALLLVTAAFIIKNNLCTIPNERPQFREYCPAPTSLPAHQQSPEQPNNNS